VARETKEKSRTTNEKRIKRTSGVSRCLGVRVASFSQIIFILVNDDGAPDDGERAGKLDDGIFSFVFGFAVLRDDVAWPNSSSTTAEKKVVERKLKGYLSRQPDRRKTRVKIRNGRNKKKREEGDSHVAQHHSGHRAAKEEIKRG
jgi:hypothetical protein